MKDCIHTIFTATKSRGMKNPISYHQKGICGFDYNFLCAVSRMESGSRLFRGMVVKLIMDLSMDDSLKEVKKKSLLCL